MQEIIYGDILFIINFSMDFLSLFITAAVLHRKVSTPALILASGIGALYAVISLFADGNGWLTLIINIGISALMCYIVFNVSIKALILFYAVSFLSGGAMTALYNLINSYRGTQKIIINGSPASVMSDIPLSRFVILAVVSLILTVICGRIFNRTNKQKSAVITATYDNTVITFTSLVDSGNLLTEPVSGMPVIVTGYATLKQLLPRELHTVFENRDVDILYQLDFKLIRRVKVIPMTAVGHSGILMGFVPDSLVADGVNITACIAADVNDTGDFGGYDAVIPSALIDL